MSRAWGFPPLLPLLAPAGLLAFLAWPAFAQSDPTRPSNLTAEVVDICPAPTVFAPAVWTIRIFTRSLEAGR